MQLPAQPLSGKQLEDFFSATIPYNEEAFISVLSAYDSASLFPAWQMLVRCIDELINLPAELRDPADRDKFLNLRLDAGPAEWLPVSRLIGANFGDEVARRALSLLQMSALIRHLYLQHGVAATVFTPEVNLDTVRDSINFFQSRRRYYVTVLSLIPVVAKGSKTVRFMELLSTFQYYIDHQLVGITTAWFYLLQNEVIPGFTFTVAGGVGRASSNFAHLEGFFLEPQRFSLLDQLELRKELIHMPKLPLKPDELLFSFVEVENTLKLYAAAFAKYHVEQLTVFTELCAVVDAIKPYVNKDGYHIGMDREQFKMIADRFPSLVLTPETGDYLAALNSVAPFQHVNHKYYSTVVLLLRFVSTAINAALVKNKSFQINSGFVFEDRIKVMLNAGGYHVADVKRIGRKEFDVVTTKNNRIVNFQCKNNSIDIALVQSDYKKLGRLNNMLCAYYEKALIKEKNREALLQTNIGHSDITHFVISRYPVITQNSSIINYNQLDRWLKDH